MNGLNGIIGHTLKPYGLPNARGRRIPAARRFFFPRLLSPKLVASKGVLNAKNQFLFAVCAQKRRDICSKWSVSAVMAFRRSGRLQTDHSANRPRQRSSASARQNNLAGGRFFHTRRRRGIPFGQCPIIRIDRHREPQSSAAFETASAADPFCPFPRLRMKSAKRRLDSSRFPA